ncbi:MAG: hypothetical protein QF709_02515 [Candidatus Thalassarchaeum sp.]|nr:hypothetical protein [Candidatus Thalassarchaeum sp.]MDP6920771.1 hypothetical protein [Candidatus Thalassarchaeum sp.]MEE2606308.1 hypothetical protein [Candidatus Thermoplasmatota archaeon]
MVASELEDWPGVLHREGRTLCRLSRDPSESGPGPAAKGQGAVFHNPAMSGNRTRSVLLLQHCIEAGLLGEGAIYALDGLSASGLRARRWLNELPAQSAARISATMGDMDPVALEWAMRCHEEFPPEHGEGELLPHLGDLRKSVLEHGRHWVDIDPYGSPLPFLDTAIQSLAKRGVAEISATDSAALTGSSKSALLRRYGARVRTDGLAHDSGLRVLLATVARTAARHERAIEPLLSVWESHHLRVSVRVRRSVEKANEVEESLGWRVASPTVEEVSSSIQAGMHPDTELDSLPMHCMLPLTHPIDRSDKRVSGPMWIGSLGQSDAMASMTEERALGICGPSDVEDDPVGWSDRDFERERRRVARSVRHISGEAEVIDAPHLILVDDLASWLGSGSPPSPSGMVTALCETGSRAAVAHYGKPAFRTDAPWVEIARAALNLQPPI